MRQMMFDVVELAAEGVSGKGFGQQFGRGLALAPITEPVAHEPYERDVLLQALEEIGQDGGFE